MKETEALIIGGGISGLATAWYLAQQGIQVELWESERRPGGKIASTRENGYLTERAAGMLVNFRSEIDQLVTSLALDNQKTSRNDKLNRYVVHQGELVSVPMKIAGMALSPLWSRRAKLRLMMEIMVPRSRNADASVSEFIKRRLGSEILETAIDPFVAGTLASDPDLAEARSVLPRLTELEQRYGSLTLGMLVNGALKRRRANNAESFSFQDGISELITQLSSTPGVRIRYGMKVDEIHQKNGGWQVVSSSQKQFTPQLILSTPAYSAGDLLSNADPQLSSLLSGIEYSPIGVLHLGLHKNKIAHPLDGTGFLVPRHEPFSFNGNLWMSRLFPNRAPTDHQLLTTYLGGHRHREQMMWNDEKIISETLSNLTPLLGIHGEPDYVRLDRHSRGLPMYHGKYQLRISKIQERVNQLPGLHLSANYLDGVSVRERIYQGQKTASRVCHNLIKAGNIQEQDIGILEYA